MNILIGFVALILLWIGVLHMLDDNWRPACIFFGLGIVAIHLLPEVRRRGGLISILFH